MRLEEIKGKWNIPSAMRDRVYAECERMLISGKMLRSCWVLDTWAAQQQKPAPLYVLDAALALECVHTASLVVDDLPEFDDAKLRRGEACAHTHEEDGGAGRAFALSISAALIAFQISLLGLATCHAPSSLMRSRVGTVMQLYGSSTIAASIGQITEAWLEKHPSTAEAVNSAPSIRKIHILKTAALFTCAPTAGVLMSKSASQEKVADALAMGLALGLLFQMWDDAADLEEDAAHMNMLRVEGLGAAVHRWSRLVNKVVEIAMRNQWWTPFLSTLMRKLHSEFACVIAKQEEEGEC